MSPRVESLLLIWPLKKPTRVSLVLNTTYISTINFTYRGFKVKFKINKRPVGLTGHLSITSLRNCQKGSYLHIITHIIEYTKINNGKIRLHSYPSIQKQLIFCILIHVINITHKFHPPIIAPSHPPQQPPCFRKLDSYISIIYYLYLFSFTKDYCRAGGAVG